MDIEQLKDILTDIALSLRGESIGPGTASDSLFELVERIESEGVECI